MQLSSACRYAFIVCSMCILLIASHARVRVPQPVKFQHVGDYSLSQKLAAAAEAEFKRSPDFRLSDGNEPCALVVTIMRNVEWERVGKKTRLTYTVRFSSAQGSEIDIHKGSCWEGALSRCAAQIVIDAKTAGRKIPK